MTRFFTLLSLSLVFLSPPTVKADSTSTYWFSPFLGYTVLNGPDDFARYWNNGPAIGLISSSQFSDNLELLLPVYFGKNSFNQDRFYRDLDISPLEDGISMRTEDMGFFGLGFGLRYHFNNGSRWTPFITSDLGWSFIFGGSTTISTDLLGDFYLPGFSETGVVLGAGAGCRFLLTDRFNLFCEGLYDLDLFGSYTEHYIKLRAGLDVRTSFNILARISNILRN